MKIIEYKTLDADDGYTLDYNVMAAIRDGWQPYGSIGVSSIFNPERDLHVYIQPMVRYESS